MYNGDYRYEKAPAPARRWHLVVGVAAVLLLAGLALGIGLGLGLQHHDTMRAGTIYGAVPSGPVGLASAVGGGTGVTSVATTTRMVTAQPSTVAMTVVSLVPVTVGAPPATVTTRVDSAPTNAAVALAATQTTAAAAVAAAATVAVVAAQPAAALANLDPCSQNQCNGDSDCSNTAGEIGRTHGHCYATCPRRCH